MERLIFIKSQPTWTKQSLKGAWSRHVTTSFYRAMHYSAKSCDRMSSVCLSVRPSVCLSFLWRWWIMTIGWKSWKLIARTISLTSSLLYSPKVIHLLPGSMEKFWGRNVRSTPWSIKSGWIESTESHVILGRDVTVWLFVYFCRRIARSSLR